MQKIEIYCPKCDSTDIDEKVIKDDFVVRKSIDDYVQEKSSNAITAVAAVFRTYTTVVECKNCGYKKTYQGGY